METWSKCESTCKGSSMVASKMAWVNPIQIVYNTEWWETVLMTFYTFLASLVAQRLKRLPAMWETWVQSLGREDSPGEGNGNPLQYSCLENPMDRGAWWATVHRVAKSRTQLSDFTHSLITSERVPVLRMSYHRCWTHFVGFYGLPDWPVHLNLSIILRLVG